MNDVAPWWSVHCFWFVPVYGSLLRATVVVGREAELPDVHDAERGAQDDESKADSWNQNHSSSSHGFTTVHTDLHRFTQKHRMIKAKLMPATLWITVQFTQIHTSSHRFTPVCTHSHKFTPIYTCSHRFTPVHSSSHQDHTDSHLFTQIHTKSHRFTLIHTSSHRFTQVHTDSHKSTGLWRQS